MPNEIQIKHDDVLNADEASTWLKIPKSTLYKLCSEGELPAAKVGRHWRFHRETLEQWLLEKTQRPQATEPGTNSEE
jgi:excisionase family DNA binding protein